MQKQYLGIVLIACLVASTTGCANTGEKGSRKSEPAALPSSTTPSDEKSQRTSEEAAKEIVVAKVNGVEITMHALVRMMNRIAGKSGAVATNPEEMQQVKQKALDRLVLQELAYQEAQHQGLRADPEAIDAAVGNLKANVGGEEGFKQFLEKEQVTEQGLRSQVERSLTLEHIYAREVYRKVTIPEDELKKAYEREKGKYIKPETVSVVDVFFPSKDGAESLAERAEKVRTRLLQDKDRDPWHLTLDGTFIVRNYKPRTGKDRELLEEARKMKAGEISPVIKAPDGFHIIKLREYSPERQLTFEEVKGYLESQLRVPAQDKRLREWEQELRKNATIEIVDAGVVKEQARTTASP